MAGHLDAFTADAPDALVFTGVKGGPLRRSNFNKLVDWPAAVASVGLPGLHFHDLRHSGNTLAAPYASTRELMARMGHSGTRAAVIYQHASQERDRAIADALDAVVEAGCRADREREAGA
ncbi:MAG TPA: tyrosine-type recombinase/integrase [Nakamurella sp.]|nr:tyrosine-type recombinase/integrase [Nakamurella sp.]